MKSLVLAILLLSPTVSLANSYDDDEQTKRAAQTLVNIDQHEREAAAQRAEAAQRKSSGNHGDGSALFLILGGMAVGFWRMFKK